MSKNKKNIISSVRGVAKVVLSFLFLFYFISNSFFYHVHEENGVKIIHSHIFFPDSDSETPNHTHSNYEYILISEIGHNLLGFLTLLFIPLVLLLIRFILSIVKTTAASRKIVFSSGLAPPISLA